MIDTTLPNSRRRGSVLILVVVLLVLLALAGTAYLATVRSDRTSTGIATELSAGDLMMESARQLVLQKLIDDLPTAVRSNGTVHPDAEAWDHPETDPWLGDRIPFLYSTGTASFPVWRFASNISDDSSIAYRFDSPFDAASAILPGNKSDYLLEPTAYNGNPAFLVRQSADGNPVSPDPVAAADADGDGIADSPYYKLPGARVGDLTYYVGVRIIDNTAAINVNTAWDRDADYAIGLGPPSPSSAVRHYGMFPSNVGLTQLLADYNPTDGLSAELVGVNRYRFGFLPSDPMAWLDTATDAEPKTDFDLSIPAAPVGRDDLVYLTQGEALWSQLARRINNPGVRLYQAPVSYRFRSFPVGDMAALAYRFCLGNTLVPPSALEHAPWGLPASLYTHSSLKSAPYDAAAVSQWFVDNFDYDGDTGTPPPRPVRPLLVTSNPVGNLAPPHKDATTGNVPAPIQNLPNTDAGRTPAGTDLRYPTYRRGGSLEILPIARTSINTASFGELWRAFWAVMHESNADQVPNDGLARMFRSEHTGLTTPYDQLLLRAALAAVNAEDLRDFDDDISEHTLSIDGKTITVFGTEKQVFISEVIVQLGLLDGTDDDYIAIELYNPYETLGDDASIKLNNWQLAAFDRATGTFTHLHTFTSTDEVTNRGFLVIVSDPAKRPLDVTEPVGTRLIQPNLVNAIGQELILLRPRLASGTPSGPEPPTAPTDADMAHFVPADQVDLTGMSTGALATAERWRHARLAPGPGASADAWKCVYPGAHVMGANPAEHGFAGPDDTLPETTPGTLGAENTDKSYTAPAFSIPLNDYQWPGPRHIPGVPITEKVAFPYGGFARNGDILMVPFIGACKIEDATRVLAMNSVTLDAAYAEQATPVDEGQFVGRFAPITRTRTDATGYDWAADLFEHLTAHQNPDSDYLPNTNPEKYVALRADLTKAPQPVANGPVSIVAKANQYNEAGVGTQGLININTAPPQVLNMLLLKQPLDDLTTTNSADRLNHNAANRAIADAIWQQQMVAPFKSPFDLLRLEPVKFIGDPANDPAAVDFTEEHGDVSPFTPTAPAGDGVLDDFEQHYLALTRLSNLITTRSDCYTVYIVLEGWRDAESPAATRMTQRRAAFIVDRAGYTPVNPRLSVTPVPVE